MPNTPKGGGISRKIFNPADRKKIRTILNDYDSQLLEEGIISSSLNLINTKKEDWTYLINTLCLDELDYIYIFDIKNTQCT